MKNLTVVFVLLIAVAFLVACGGEKKAEQPAEQKQTEQSHEGHATEGEMTADMVTDPVCGMKIKKEDAFASMEYQGNIYYFCMEADYKTFQENPEKYLTQN